MVGGLLVVPVGQSCRAHLRWDMGHERNRPILYRKLRDRFRTCSMKAKASASWRRFYDHMHIHS